MKSPDDIFNWLVRNSVYYTNHLDREEVAKAAREYETDPILLDVWTTYVVPLHAELDRFVAFLGEPYSYRKHILPLVDAGLISVCNGSNDPAFDETSGLVHDYDKDQSKVCYWIGANPNR